MVKSVDVNNIRVGFVDESGSSEDFISDFMTGSVRSLRTFKEIDHCLSEMKNKKIASCMVVVEKGGTRGIDVYMDSNNKVIEFYSKQFVLSSVLENQNQFIEESSEDISNKMNVYHASIVDARNELRNTKEELILQRDTLVEKRNELWVVKNDFDSVYIPLKEREFELNILRQELQNNQVESEDALERVRDIQDDLESLEDIFVGGLNPEDAEAASLIINSILSDLNHVESFLESTDDSYAEIYSALDLIDSTIVKLDRVNELLISTDEDLEEAIYQTGESIEKIDSFIFQLDFALEELSFFSEDFDQSPIVVDFSPGGEQTSLGNDAMTRTFPLLVAIIITFTSLILSNMFVLKQTNRLSYFREAITPTKNGSFVFADYFVNLFFVFIQVVILFLIGLFWMNLSLDFAFLYFLVIFVSSSFFIFVGMGFGYLIKSQSLSLLLTVFLVMLFFILSNLIAPSMLLSSTVKFFVDLNPFVMLVGLLENVFILKDNFYVMFDRFLIFVVYLLAAFIFAMGSKKFSKNKIEY